MPHIVRMSLSLVHCDCGCVRSTMGLRSETGHGRRPLPVPAATSRRSTRPLVPRSSSPSTSSPLAETRRSSVHRRGYGAVRADRSIEPHSDLPLGLTHEDVGDSSPTMGSGDVHLLDLVVNDHDEASDGSVDDSHCRVADPSRRPCPERVLSPDVDQFLRDKAEVAVLPTEMPDLGDVACILGPGLAQRHSRTVRNHRPTVLTHRPRATRRGVTASSHRAHVGRVALGRSARRSARLPGAPRRSPTAVGGPRRLGSRRARAFPRRTP